MTRHPLFGLALLSAGLHVLGLAMAGVVLRHGTPLAPLPQRLAWLARAPLGWTVGWAVWILCALSLAALVTALASRLRAAAPHEGSHAAGVLAIALTSAGVALDVGCNALWIAVLPELARAALAGAEGGTALFLGAERALTVVGTAGANVLYSLAVLLLSALSPRTSGAWRTSRGLGLLTGAAGLALGVAGAVGHTGAVAVLAGATIGGFVLWTCTLAWAARSA